MQEKNRHSKPDMDIYDTIISMIMDKQRDVLKQATKTPISSFKHQKILHTSDGLEIAYKMVYEEREKARGEKKK